MKLRVQPSQIRLMWGREKDTRLSGEPVKTSVTCSGFVAGADSAGSAGSTGGGPEDTVHVVSLFDWRCRYECMPTRSTCCECIRRLRYTAVCDATCDLYSCPCMSCAPR